MINITIIASAMPACGKTSLAFLLKFLLVFLNYTVIILESEEYPKQNLKQKVLELVKYYNNSNDDIYIIVLKCAPTRRNRDALVNLVSNYHNVNLTYLFLHNVSTKEALKRIDERGAAFVSNKIEHQSNALVLGSHTQGVLNLFTNLYEPLTNDEIWNGIDASQNLRSILDSVVNLIGLSFGPFALSQAVKYFYMAQKMLKEQKEPLLLSLQNLAEQKKQKKRTSNRDLNTLILREVAYTRDEFTRLLVLCANISPLDGSRKNEIKKVEDLTTQDYNRVIYIAYRFISNYRDFTVDTRHNITVLYCANVNPCDRKRMILDALFQYGPTAIVAEATLYEGIHPKTQDVCLVGWHLTLKNPNGCLLKKRHDGIPYHITIEINHGFRPVHMGRFLALKL